MFWQLIRDILKVAGGGGMIGGLFGLGGEDLNTIVTASSTIVTAVGVLWGVYVRKGTVAVPAATGRRADVPTVSSATGITEPTTRKS